MRVGKSANLPCVISVNIIITALNGQLRGLH